MSNEPIRVLVVDDTAIYRKIVAEALQQTPGIEIVGTAAHGRMALTQIRQLRPDIVTLDVEMPVMDGLETLRQLKRLGMSVGVIMLSAQTADSAQATVTALELGALDFVLKPSAGNLAENARKLRESLASRVISLGRVQRIRQVLGGAVRHPASAPTTPGRVPAGAAGSGPRPAPRTLVPPRVVAIGISTGGPQTLQRLIPRLPADLSVPVLIVQHMPPVFTRSLAEDLDRRSVISVCEAAHEQPVLPGHVYIAPGGRQMRLAKEDDNLQIAITDDPRENSCRPSVDYLFRSVADVYGAHSLALIMTGMGNDGAAGCRLIRQCGGTVMAQDEQSCVVFGMPRQPIEEGLADLVGPPERLATEIVQLVRRKEFACR
ncbi:MAG: chemotaxis response regulator protein-glutamate methylesterase [Planctomycetaceae bacterium]|nr:chemotaxis response regulator protein-glutamate methylesterase [Planctomycetaceae bacterium]